MSLIPVAVAVAAAMVLLLLGYLAGRRERDPEGRIAALQNQLDESERLRAIGRDTYLSRIGLCADNGCLTLKGPTP